MAAIVDVQGLKTANNRFIPKEIAILVDNEVHVILIKPPFPFHHLSEYDQKVASWLKSQKLMSWNEGYVAHNAYHNCLEFLKPMHVYVRGSEKARWLRSVLEGMDDNVGRRGGRRRKSNVHNLEMLACPSLSKLHRQYRRHADIVACRHHKRNCAHRNVQYIRNWNVECGVNIFQ